MSITYRHSVAGMLALSGLLFGLAFVTPITAVAQVMTIAPEEDRDVPEGSQIPDRRVEEVEEKVRALKESRLRQTRPAQTRESQPQGEAPEAGAPRP